MTFRNILLIVALAVFALAVFLYFMGDSGNGINAPQDLAEGSQEATSTDEIAGVNQEQEVGEVGEVAVEDELTGEQEPLVSPELPLNIFSTTAVILEIKSDFLIAQGVGDNFADGEPRELKCFFDENSLTFTKDMAKYRGLEGLEILGQGMEVKIGSRENIRGKTEFTIKTISILN